MDKLESFAKYVRQSFNLTENKEDRKRLLEICDLISESNPSIPVELPFAVYWIRILSVIQIYLAQKYDLSPNAIRSIIEEVISSNVTIDTVEVTLQDLIDKPDELEKKCHIN